MFNEDAATLKQAKNKLMKPNQLNINNTTVAIQSCWLEKNGDMTANVMVNDQDQRNLEHVYFKENSILFEFNYKRTGWYRDFITKNKDVILALATKLEGPTSLA